MTIEFCKSSNQVQLTVRQSVNKAGLPNLFCILNDLWQLPEIRQLLFSQI